MQQRRLRYAGCVTVGLRGCNGDVTGVVSYGWVRSRRPDRDRCLVNRNQQILAVIAVGVALMAVNLIWHLAYTMEIGTFIVCMGVLAYIGNRRKQDSDTQA